MVQGRRRADTLCYTARVIAEALLLVGALALLVLSGQWALKLLHRLTVLFGISEFAAAFVLLAVTTSLPEIAVAVSAALREEGELAVATILGSHVVNSTFILGLAAVLVGGLRTKSLDLRRDLVFGTAILLLSTFFTLDGSVLRGEGIALLLAFVWYLSHLRRERLRPPAFHRGLHVQDVLALPLFFAVVALLLWSANLAVGAAGTLALALGISPFLLGVFLLAFGTSLPELVTTVIATVRRRPAFALGTMLGTNVTNAALALGVAPVLRQLRFAADEPLLVTAGAAAVAAVLLAYFARSRAALSRREGSILLVLFTLYVLLLSFGGFDGLLANR